MNANDPKPCPVCGAMLTAALADAVADPTKPESCPRRDGKPSFATGGIIPQDAQTVGITISPGCVIPSTIVSKIPTLPPLPAVGFMENTPGIDWYTPNDGRGTLVQIGLASRRTRA